MRIKSISAKLSKTLICLFFIIGVGPYTLVTAHASRWLALWASGYTYVPSASSESVPRLLTQNNSNRGVALDAQTFLAEPFSLNQLIPFASDRRTRLVFFGTNIDLLPGAQPLGLTADAEDVRHRIYPLQVEYMDRMPVGEALYAIHVRLHDEMIEDGDVLVRIYVNGVPTNRVRVGLGRVGGGLPDDGGPQILQLSPSSLMAGASDSMLSVMGSNFTADSKLLLNGVERSTNVASDNLLSTMLTSSDVATPGSYIIAIKSSLGVSNSVVLTVNSPQPSVSSISPASVLKGGSGFTLNVSGNGFVQGSVVNFNGSNRVTIFVSATLLTAQILASDIVGAGNFPIKVVNAGPGGGTSPAVSLMVAEPAPTPTPKPSPTATPNPTPTPSGVISYSTAVSRLSLAPAKTAYYRFTETSGTSIVDSSGGSHTGTLAGAVTLNQPSLLSGGDNNPSASFSGGKLFSNAFMPMLTTGLTLSTMFEPMAWPTISNRYSIVAVGTGSASNGFFQLSYDNNPNVFFYKFQDTTGATVTVLFPVLHGTTLNRRYHLAVTHDFVTKTVKLYLDGMLVSTQTHNQTPRSGNNQPVQVGGDNVVGYIDETLIAGDRVLTGTEVRSLLRAKFGADQNATAFYVSPTGSNKGSGAIDSPIDLITALRTGLVGPGETYWLRGGTYGTGGSTMFYSILQGTASAPIIVRGYPGERATIDGGIDADVNGPHIWFWGFEIMNSNTNRSPSSTGGTQSSRSPGLTLRGAGSKAINMVIHDTGHPGIFFPNTVGDKGEIYGTLIYHTGVLLNGTTATGSGVYAQNDEGTRYIKDVIAFRNWTTGFKVYTEQAYIDGYHVEGNICFNNGQWDIFIVSKVNPARDLRLFNNYTYEPPGGMSGVQLGYYNHDMYSGEVRNNYFVTGANNNPAFWAKRWTNLVVDGNTFIGKQRAIVWDTPLSNLSPVTTGLRLNNNRYYSNLASPSFVYNNSALNFANWKATTGFDADSRLFQGNPLVNRIFVRANEYERGRANIAIYNWENLPSVEVDLSEARLVNGQAFEIRDAQNFYGPPVASGIYSPGNTTIRIPMSGLVAAPSVGSIWTTVRHTAPGFGAFVVLPVNSAS